VPPVVPAVPITDVSIPISDAAVVGCEDDGSTEDDDRSVEDVDEEALLALSHLELVPDGSVDRAGQENSFVAIAPSSSHTPRT